MPKLKVTNMLSGQVTLVEGTDTQVEHKLRLMFHGPTENIEDGHLGDVIHAVARIQHIGVVALDGVLPAPSREPEEEELEKAEFDKPRIGPDWLRVELPTEQVYELRTRDMFDAGGAPMPSAHLRRGVTGPQRWQELLESVGQHGIRDPIEIDSFPHVKQGAPHISDGHHRVALAMHTKMPTVPVAMPPAVAARLGLK